MFFFSTGTLGDAHRAIFRGLQRCIRVDLWADTGLLLVLRHSRGAGSDRSLPLSSMAADDSSRCLLPQCCWRRILCFHSRTRCYKGHRILSSVGNYPGQTSPLAVTQSRRGRRFLRLVLAAIPGKFERELETFFQPSMSLDWKLIYPFDFIYCSYFTILSTSIADHAATATRSRVKRSDIRRTRIPTAKTVLSNNRKIIVENKMPRSKNEFVV